MLTTLTLQQLGWRTFHSQQPSPAELDTHFPARIAGLNRSGIRGIAECGELELIVPREIQRDGVASVLAVGDWVLVERDAPRIRRRLERESAIVRVAAGSDTRPQAVAANVDVLFVVTSCNHDFNAARLERYLALALDGGVEPVIVLTKTDLCDDVSSYVDRARAVAGGAGLIALNSTEASDYAAFDSWLEPGRTVAFVGSSGVGKSTLVNGLLGAERQVTAPIREDDSRGRHTTTSRDLVLMPGGTWLIDTPGMRELRIGAAHDGVDSAFDDVTALALHCRFRDCRHDGDDGCAVRAAIHEGRLDARRHASYLKLVRETQHAMRTVHERRESERRTGKLHKNIQARKRRERGD